MNSKIKLCIVDDDKLVSLSLQTILEASGQVEVLGIGTCGEQAMELYEHWKPDILLMDIRMESMSGLDAATILLEKYPDAKILLLTTFADDEYIIKALHIGVKG
ncbi:MAG: response regulator transcription factor, partial [Lachnospiraceae bacterium]|nr:response regulator transcription factor [Lachnospiraceae bacterium]